MSVDNRRFRRAGRVRGAVLLAAAVLGVAGCSGSTEGAPTAVESVAASPESGSADDTSGASASTTAKSDPAKAWDPCQLPDSAITATGLDTASKESGIADVDFSGAGWNICSWRASAGWYWVHINSGPSKLDEVRARPDYTDYTDKTVGTRPAVQFRDDGEGGSLRCHIAVEVSHGIVMFTAAARASVGAKEDMCEVVGRHVAALEQSLPAE
ncbi:DUF3558 domain-containing protein [Nocardia cyriacigeorgica]|nr:DUF3558 domain-containing protein [Nocardia cyriacigeorgica]